MGLVAFFAAPVVLAVCWFILLFKKRREGLGIALFFFCAVLAAGVWSIRQSRASTAAIGLVFLPSFGALCGLLGWLSARLRRHPAPPARAASWACLCAAVLLVGLYVGGGFKEKEKNRRRDEAWAEESKRMEANREAIKSLLAQNKGHESEALEAQIEAHAGDRAFLIPAIETPFVSEATLDKLSRSDSGVVLSVVRNKNTSPATLDRIYRESSYPQYFYSDMAANERTPPEILRKIFDGRDPGGGVDQWLAGNPSTPKDILQKLASSPRVWVLRELLLNKALDCDLLQAVKDRMGRPGLDDQYKAAEYVNSTIKSLEPRCASRDALNEPGSPDWEPYRRMARHIFDRTVSLKTRYPHFASIERAVRSEASDRFEIEYQYEHGLSWAPNPDYRPYKKNSKMMQSFSPTDGIHLVLYFYEGSWRGQAMAVPLSIGKMNVVYFIEGAPGPVLDEIRVRIRRIILDEKAAFEAASDHGRPHPSVMSVVYTLSVKLQDAFNSGFEIRTDVRIGEAFHASRSNGAVKNSISGVLHAPSGGRYPLTLAISEWRSDRDNFSEKMELSLERGQPWSGGVVQSSAYLRTVTLWTADDAPTEEKPGS